MAWLSMRAEICLLLMSEASSFSRPLRFQGAGGLEALLGMAMHQGR